MVCVVTQVQARLGEGEEPFNDKARLLTRPDLLLSLMTCVCDCCALSREFFHRIVTTDIVAFTVVI